MNNKTRLLIYLMVISLVIPLSIGWVFSEVTAEEKEITNQAVSVSASEQTTETTAASTESAETEPATIEETLEPSPSSTEINTEETKWLWAEVTSVDVAANQFTVKYLSYESDEEKELTLAVDSVTTLENFESLSDMVAGDNVSVDYTTDQSGKALAKSISLQKAKAASETPETKATTESSTAVSTEEPVSVTTGATAVNAVMEKTVPSTPTAAPAAAIATGTTALKEEVANTETEPTAEQQ